MIKKALITCAGFGTRLLPITKTIQKEMMPILNRPTIDYIVRDCVAAGIKEIIFVINESETRLVEHFYTEHRLLKLHLEKTGKLTKYQEELSFYKDINFQFVIQTEKDNYGTAIPVKLSKKYLENEDAFLVFMGDDFIFNSDGTSEAKAMMELFNNSNSKGLITCITKPENELYRYGVAEVEIKNNFTYLTNLIEKPKTGTAPSNLTNISKYIFTPEIFDIIENQMPNESNGEYYITDSATILAKNNNVCVYTPTGRYLDGGNLLSWLKANIVVAKSNPQIKTELRNFIKEEFNF